MKSNSDINPEVDLEIWQWRGLQPLQMWFGLNSKKSNIFFNS